MVPRREFDAVLTSALDEPLLAGFGAALLLELLELLPHALKRNPAATNGIRNLVETRTVTLLLRSDNPIDDTSH